jgi:hypothetical protein
LVDFLKAAQAISLIREIPDSQETILAWLLGMNPICNDEAPIVVLLRDGDVETFRAAVTNFIVEG